MAAPIPLREVYQLKIELDYIQPPIWRMLLVSSTIGLKELNNTLLRVMGWDGSHMSEFSRGSQRFGEVFSDLPTGCDDWSNYQVNDLLTDKGDSIQFVYDFGDGWDHSIVLQGILPFDKDSKNACLSLRCSSVPT